MQTRTLNESFEEKIKLEQVCSFVIYNPSFLDGIIITSLRGHKAKQTEWAFKQRKKRKRWRAWFDITSQEIKQSNFLLISCFTWPWTGIFSASQFLTWWYLAANCDRYLDAAAELLRDGLEFELGTEIWLLKLDEGWACCAFSGLSDPGATELLRRVFWTTSRANADWKQAEGESVAPRLSILPCSSCVNSRISNSGLRLRGVAAMIGIMGRSGPWLSAGQSSIVLASMEQLKIKHYLGFIQTDNLNNFGNFASKVKAQNS